MRGECLCGTVSFEVDVTSLRLYRCHCSLCRRQSGTASSLAGIVSNRQFRWLSGEETVSSWQRPSGFRTDFCSTCGCPVPNPLRTTSKTWVPAGLFEEDAAIAVAVDIYTGSMAPWDPTVLVDARFEALPEVEEFLALLHGE